MQNRKHAADDFSHSITDLMTSIAVVFVLLFLFFAQQQRSEVNETEDFLKKLLDRLKVEFDDRGVEVVQGRANEETEDPLTIEVILPEELTFEVNDARLGEEGQKLVREMVPGLLQIVCSSEFRRGIDSVVVEGHADTTDEADKNLTLSTDRAAAVLLFAYELADDQESCFEQLIAASGRGEWHPRVDAAGQEIKGKSRRVVFRLRVKSLEQRKERVASLQPGSGAPR